MNAPEIPQTNITPDVEWQTGSRLFKPGHRVLQRLPERLQQQAKKRVAAVLTDYVEKVVPESELLVLRASEKAQTFLFKNAAETLIAKRHGQIINYARESMAFLVLADDAPVPCLLRSYDQERVLLIEHLPLAFVVSNTEDICAVAESLALIHATEARLQSDFAELFASRVLRSEAIASNTVDVADRRSLRTLFRLMLDFYGDDYISCTVGDVKSEHLMKRVRQDSCLFIDLETLQPGGLEFVDLLSLVNLLPRNVPLNWTHVLNAYRRVRSTVSRVMDLDDLAQCLRLTAASYGLPAEFAP